MIKPNHQGTLKSITRTCWRLVDSVQYHTGTKFCKSSCTPGQWKVSTPMENEIRVLCQKEKEEDEEELRDEICKLNAS
jgi:hypothetical protein